MPEVPEIPEPGSAVLVTGAGITGRAILTALAPLGVHATLTDDRPAALAEYARQGVSVLEPAAATAAIADFALVVTSPGFPPTAPMLAAARTAGVPVWGDIELAWRLDRSGRYGPPKQWLVVTGTNGKTTTTEMLAAILARAGVDAVACGNIGHPVVTAVAGGHAVLAVELSSFQLHWSPSVRPAAGVVLNVAEDHLDWHGGMDAYAAAKARALLGDVAVGGVDDPVAARLLGESPAPRRVGVTLGRPGPDQLGVADGVLTDRAFGGGELRLDPPGMIDEARPRLGQPHPPPAAVEQLRSGDLLGLENISAWERLFRPLRRPTRAG